MLSCMRNQRSQMMPCPTSRTLWEEGISDKSIKRFSGDVFTLLAAQQTKR